MRSNLFIKFLMILIVCPIALAQDIKLEDNQPEGEAKGTVVIVLTRGRQLKGDISSIKTIAASTSFGDAEFPIEKIEGIKLHIDEKDSCVFAFKNGDLVTGQLKFDKLSLATDWGDANINVASIETIKLNPKGEFFQDSTGGKARWRYGETREVQQRTLLPGQNSVRGPITRNRNNR